MQDTRSKMSFKSDYFVARARQLWVFVDPKAINNPNILSLNLSLFNPLAITQYDWFKNWAFVPGGGSVEYQIDNLLLAKAREVVVLFYHKTEWFNAKHSDLRAYVTWCNTYYNYNYSLDMAKMEAYLRFKLEERRAKGAVGDTLPIEETCRELFHRLKPTLERLAGWQGNMECASSSDR